MKEEQKSEIIIYKDSQGPEIKVSFDAGTLWLSQADIAELFAKDTATISRHIAHIYKEKGKSNRRFFPFKNFSESDIFTDGAYACLAGICFFEKGIYAFHDLPGRAGRTRIEVPKGTVYGGVLGGGYSYWRHSGEIYQEELKSIVYLPQPNGSEDYSFAYLVDMSDCIVYCGYYYSPRGGVGRGGDGWDWD